MNAGMPTIYIVDEEEVERSSTLDPSDMGRVFVVVSGTLVLFDTQEDAVEYFASNPL